MKEKFLSYLHIYKVEVCLCVGVIILTSLGIGALYKTAQPSKAVIKVSKGEEAVVPASEPSGERIWVDISGGVKKPGAYSIASGSRLSDVLEEAGGLSEAADADFFYRNFNNARILVDQEKIYIPRFDEVQQGIFIEGRYIVDQGLPVKDAATATSDEDLGSGADSSGKISVNTASLEELDTLPGIGEITAQKIIDNRPYASLDELVEKKSVGQSVFDKIKDSLVVE